MTKTTETTKKACGTSHDGASAHACVLESGHDGPIHVDASGNDWSDDTLPLPEHIARQFGDGSDSLDIENVGPEE